MDLNATQAAIRAGYSARSAEVQASKLLRNAKVSRAVKAAQSERLDRLELTADRVLQEIAALAFADLRALYDEEGRFKPIKDWPDHAAKAIAGIETLKHNETAGDGVQEKVLKLKSWDKPKALEMLAKHFALLVERVDVRGLDELAARLAAGRKRAEGK